MATTLIHEMSFAVRGARRAADPGQALRMLVLGDFSGAGPAARPRTAWRVDIDNVDQVMERLAPEVWLELDGASHVFAFRELEDFHPDQLYLKSDAFRDLREQRRRLKDPASFAQAAAQLQGTGAGNPFADLLGGASSRPTPAQTAADRLVRSLLGAMPAGPDPRQADYIAAVDAVIAERMDAVLHAPAFQALEAAWRGLHELVTGLELDEHLQLHILDAGKEDLQANAASLRQLLVEEPRSAADGAPWSLLCGAYAFGSGEQDVHLLSVLGALGAEAGAPFIAAAAPSLAGAASLAAHPDPADWQPLEGQAGERWQALRASPQAPWLGLALPRVLLRLPYGKLTDPVSQFTYEEALHDHKHYLWGHASLACALLLGRAFADDGWDLMAHPQQDLDGLPAHTVRRGGEAHMQACAEAWLSERAGDALLRHGLMPLLSYRNRPAARLLRFQSIAAPARPLAGAWRD